MDKRLPPLLGIFSLAVVLTLLSTALNFPPHAAGAHSHTEEYPVHADFAIVADGRKLSHLDFAFDCSTGEPRVRGKPDLEASDHIAHVTHAGQTWRDFLTTMGVISTGKDCLAFPSGEKWCDAPDVIPYWQMIVNGKNIPWNLDVEIHNLDRVLFIYAPQGFPESSGAFERFVTNDACVYSEKCSRELDAEHC